MFRTMRESELMSGLVGPTSAFQFWSFVELETLWPWFHVETIDTRGDCRHTGTVLASNVQLLKDLVSCRVNAAWVNQVQIVTPGCMNGSGSWKMEILERLYEVVDSDGGVLGHDYQVLAGKTYSTVEDKSQNIFKRLLYTAIDSM
ncbi:hypothetical protein [Pseudomonas moraviensis]|uniref:hypothetical protein n=1 Tax=Pseudomonas moraviensis TaxID=321662 RepID=UPI002092AA2D|nr:hypothetical protein [Pseudomonas moraviensis]UST68623.1 hypothetical protein NF674_22745 [Pseudomonas moraviensis]